LQPRALQPRALQQRALQPRALQQRGLQSRNLASRGCRQPPYKSSLGNTNTPPRELNDRVGFVAWATCGVTQWIGKTLGRRVPIVNDMGLKKTALYVAGLSLAVGGPASVFSTAHLMTGTNGAAPPGVTAQATQQGTAGTISQTPAIAQPGSPMTVNLPPIQSMPTPSLAEVLNFDVTVESILRQWPRVTTGLPYMQLQGYRVPLVTGGALTDVAGALTYYFNPRQQVQRITLRGTTGDPSVLATILTTRHQYTRRLTNDPGLILYEVVDSSNHPAGTLKIRSANIVSTSQPYMRFEVDLVMDRPE
jgi:hypothetical protein